MPVFADTHEVIKQLASEGGMNERSAEILVTALNRGLSDAVATKADLGLLQQHVDHRFDGIEARMTNKLYVVGLAMVGLIVTTQHIWK